MSPHHEILARSLTSRNFTDNVGTCNGPGNFRSHIQLHRDRLTASQHVIEEHRIRSRQGCSGNTANTLFISIAATGVSDAVAVGAHGSNDDSLGTAFSGLNVTASASPGALPVACHSGRPGRWLVVRHAK